MNAKTGEVKRERGTVRGGGVVKPPAGENGENVLWLIKDEN